MNERRVAGTIAGAAGLIAVVTLLARGMGLARIVVFADAVRAGGVERSVTMRMNPVAAAAALSYSF